MNFESWTCIIRTNHMMIDNWNLIRQILFNYNSNNGVVYPIVNKIYSGKLPDSWVQIFSKRLSSVSVLGWYSHHYSQLLPFLYCRLFRWTPSTVEFWFFQNFKVINTSLSRCGIPIVIILSIRLSLRLLVSTPKCVCILRWMSLDMQDFLVKCPDAGEICLHY